MNSLAALEALELPQAEEAFFDGLRERHDPALAHWARNYHYFSVNQARFLGWAVLATPATDADAMVDITTALFEEYGSGDGRAVHSRLFARFCLALGLDADALPLPPGEVEPGVRHYLREIEEGYRAADRAVMLATYCFLERSAVLSYPLMLTRLRALGFSTADLVFFSAHVIQEVGHDQGALRMAQRLIGSANQRHFEARILHLQSAWSRFWESFGATARVSAV